MTAAKGALGTAIRHGRCRFCHEMPPLTARNMFVISGFRVDSDWGTSTAEPSREAGP